MAVFRPRSAPSQPVLGLAAAIRGCHLQLDPACFWCGPRVLEGAVIPSYGSVIAYRICCSADLLAPPPENSLLLTSRPLSSRKDNAIRWHGSCCFTPGTEGKSKRGTV